MPFWPDEINSEEVLSPSEIMKYAGDELENKTGRLTVSIEQSHLDDRVVWAFDVQDQQSNRILNLFEASHQIDQSYPVVIKPPTRDIPEFLMRKRIVPGRPPLVQSLHDEMIAGTPPEIVENEWVCGTPSEFKKKLTTLFAEDYIKSKIISLLDSAQRQVDSRQ